MKRKSACPSKRHKRYGLMRHPWVRKIPWWRKATPVFFPGNPKDIGAWQATGVGVTKELDPTDRLNIRYRYMRPVFELKRQRL